MALAGQIVLQTLSSTLTLSQHETAEQFLDRRLGVFAQTRMHGRHLDHRAAWRHHPVESLSPGESRDWTCLRLRRADARERLDVLADDADIILGPQRGEALFIQIHAAAQERKRGTMH